MKIISWNINNDYRCINLKVYNIINLLEKYRPNIVGLQEVIPKVYDLLCDEDIIKNRYIISEKQDKSYFNIILTKFKTPMEIIPFKNSSMGREYIKQKIGKVSFINIHLESMPVNMGVRDKQINEILSNTEDYMIIFGDTNFTDDGEKFGNLNYIEYINDNDLFTYDSKINKEAIPPFRSNLDRFYTNIDEGSYKAKIIPCDGSDHYPILLEC